MVDDGGVRATLGLGALAGIVDDKRIDEGQVAEKQVGITVGGETDALPRQPL